MYNLFGTNVHLVRSSYLATEGLAVIAYTENSEVHTVLTVCLPDFYLYEEKDLAFVDINNNPGIEQFLIKNNLAKPLHFGLDSGYVCYPLYKFDLSKLIGADEYEKSNYNCK